MGASTTSRESGQTKAPAPRVVVVDDDPLVLAVTRRVLSRAGFAAVCCDHARAALCEILYERPVAVIADLHMPDVSGSVLLRLVQGLSPETRRILYTGDVSFGAQDRARPEAWIDSVVTKDAGYTELPEVLALGPVQSSADTLDARALALGVLSVLALPEGETLGHAQRLAQGALKLGVLAGLGAEELAALELGALLHDLGMLQMPELSQNNPRAFGPKDWELLRRHPALGAHSLRGAPQLARAIPVIFHHHERFDGAGYPQSLAQDQVPLGARLLSVVDTFEALTHDRPHAPARSETAARATLAQVRGTQLDPHAVDLFMAIPPDEWRSLGENASREG